MNSTPFALLLCTNGWENTRPALEYGVWLARLLQTRVRLLGVVESPDGGARAKRLVDETAQKLESEGIPFEIHMETGRGSLVIAQQAAEGKYLSVIGPLGRPTWRRIIQGRSFRRILAHVCTPILYVHKQRRELQHMLVCLGGLDYSESLVRLSLYLARAAGASLTMLHVVEPVTMQYPLSKEIHDHWKQIQETETPQGKNLRKAIEQAQEADLRFEFKVRHGNPVHEIIEEVKQGGYDLTGMGSQHSAHSLRHLYTPNITAEVAEDIDTPVLAVRQGYALVQ